MKREEFKIKILSDAYVKHLFIDSYRVAEASSNIFHTFEETEPSYFAACIKAFDYALSIEGNITVDNILKIHELSIAGIQRTNYANKFETDIINKYDSVEISNDIRNFTSLYPLNKGINCSADGIDEIKLRWEEVGVFKWQLSKTYKDLMIKHITEWKTTRFGLVALEGAHYDDELFFFSNFPKDIKVSNLQDKDLIRSLIQDTLAYYYKKISETESKEKKLSIICETIIRLEQLHPFADANCRTFCIILLNKLLLANGFYPALQHNPNKFGGYSTAEMKEELQLSILKSKLFEEFDEDKKEAFLLEMYTLDSKDKSRSPNKKFLNGILMMYNEMNYSFSIDQTSKK
jgi:prophage maintenance system killer protein